jgi:hypothetical protein
LTTLISLVRELLTRLRGGGSFTLPSHASRGARPATHSRSVYREAIHFYLAPRLSTIAKKLASLQ